MDLVRISVVASAVTLAATTGAVIQHRRGRKTPEQREMLRRQHICQKGRITSGTVLDLRELITAAGHAMQVLFYSYEVAGVRYECAQEVTHLHGRFDPDACHNGLSASVRYDPRHPGDSIVVAESWCGLRF
jgi:hypothetical protein